MPSFPTIKPGDPQGLVFESPPEPVESLSPWSDFCLREIESLRVESDGKSEPNYLIEGDNLAALMLLQKTHEGAFDLIYIDPPHNTRNKKLTYADSFAWAGDAFSHARWLSFMERRLRLARNLMSDNGSIFISIDDREAAVLKLLCDELFGERNFVASIVWKKKTHAQNDARWFSANHESILVYAKGKRIWRPNLLPRTAKMDDGYRNANGDPRGAWRVARRQPARQDLQPCGRLSHRAAVWARRFPSQGAVLEGVGGSIPRASRGRAHLVRAFRQQRPEAEAVPVGGETGGGLQDRLAQG